MTTLVICEKPSVAADVAAALTQHTFTRTPWGYQSPQMWVAAAAGHLVAELPPEGYDERYKKWEFGDLPIIPDQFKYTVRDSRAADRMRTLAELVRDPAVTQLVNACDAGREGELIFKLIVQYCRLPQPKTIRRAWFSSLTPDAITEAFDNLVDDEEMAGLEAAARARSEADWVVGMNATRAATCTLGGGRQLLTLGRVQTPTLALVVNRDLTIDNFTPTDYYTVEATFRAAGGTYTGKWRSGTASGDTDRLDNKPDADAIANLAKRVAAGTVITVDKRRETAKPPKLFDLTDLQREANRRYGMTAAATLAAAQTCYETHKVLSYPRTDSRYLPADMVGEIPAIVASVAAADDTYADVATNVDPASITHAVNDDKVTDHHAIIPTKATHNLDALSVNERRIYDLVARRLLAALLPAQLIDRTVVWTQVTDNTSTAVFRSTGRVDIAPGWRLAWPEGSWGGDDKPAKNTEADDDQALPELTERENVGVADTKVSTNQTRPPDRYNEAALLGAMATAGNLVEDDDMAEAMKERGLGTPATRASIIERLISIEYLARSGRQLKATDKGRGLIVALGDHPLTQPALTGQWEAELRNMEQHIHTKDAEAHRQQFRSAIATFATDICTGLVDATPQRMLAGRRRLARCPMPDCGGHVVEGRRAWGCDTYQSADEPGCGFVVWKENAGKKVTEKALLKRIADIASGKTPPPQPPGKRTVLGRCPMVDCDSDIVERPKSWGCTSWKGPKDTGCGYVIWKTNPDGTAVTEQQAAEMLTTGATNNVERVVFAPCPRCDGNIIDRGRALGCDSWKSKRSPGCRTTVWRTTRDGRTLTDDEVRAALAAMEGTTAPPPPKARKRR